LPIEIRRAAMWFNDTERYSIDAINDWKSLFPPGNGWVKLGVEHRPFAISMYHQMHCIEGIRHALLLSATGEDTKSDAARSHANHCFNYLRQLLLCRADTTLEPTHLVTLTNGTRGAAASGNMVLHICRDWTQVRDFVRVKITWLTHFHNNIPSLCVRVTGLEGKSNGSAEMTADTVEFEF
ncbi:hypothetical protein B0H11DRAFT_1744105, partial [Mycena galericulata]